MGASFVYIPFSCCNAEPPLLSNCINVVSLELVIPKRKNMSAYVSPFSTSSAKGNICHHGSPILAKEQTKGVPRNDTSDHNSHENGSAASEVASHESGRHPKK